MPLKTSFALVKLVLKMINKKLWKAKRLKFYLSMAVELKDCIVHPF
jgi:hypothetical protein